MSVRIPLFSCSDQSFNNMICESKLRSPVVFKGITDDGELAFAPYLLSESYCILYFDPSRNSTREALFEGVEGGKPRLIPTRPSIRARTVIGGKVAKATRTQGGHSSRSSNTTRSRALG
uniref:F-box associated beta-propeller type 3 domain-containing protein n=1 Tax=Brassica oleracea var. oleracea TaxID=109376 RepID=A0A0D3CE68_BRAOL